MNGSLDGAQRNPGRSVKLPLLQIAAPDFISLHPGYLANTPGAIAFFADPACSI